MTVGERHAMERARELTGRLRTVLSDHQDSENIERREPIGNGVWESLPEVVGLGVSPFNEIVEALDQALAVAGYGVEPMEDLPLDEFWTLGSRAKRGPIRNIHAGFLEPVLRLPLVRRVPERVVAFLLAIPGDRDLLKREHHNQVGWHYHYLNFRRARSNIVLCWDTRATRKAGQVYPLFQETHGEDHADFAGRPDLWGPTKKESMHEACVPDLDKWPLDSFRCASNKAGPVWPLTAILTPIGNVIPTNSKKVKKSRW
jgi:hypothetical protein